jgi:hypothetical protein
MLAPILVASCLFAASPEPEATSPVGYALETEGDVPDHAKSTFEEHLSSALSGAGSPQSVAIDGCSDSACLADRARDAGVPVLIFARVEAVDRDYILEVKVIGSGGEELDGVETSCDICTYDEAADALASAIAGMSEAAEAAVANAVAESSGPGQIAVRSKPSGATVLVDGAAVGVTPYEGEIEAGTHEITVEINGRESQSRSVEIEGATQESMDFTLERGARSKSKMTKKEIVGWRQRRRRVWELPISVQHPRRWHRPDCHRRSRCRHGRDLRGVGAAQEGQVRPSRANSRTPDARRSRSLRPILAGGSTPVRERRGCP